MTVLEQAGNAAIKNDSSKHNETGRDKASHKPEVAQQPALTIPGPKRIAPYISTALDIRDQSVAQREGLVDIVHAGIHYRCLDPEYYAWLRHRMMMAKRAAAAGRLKPRAYEALRRRFTRVHERAVGWFGEGGLRAAVRALRPKRYRPPGTAPLPPVEPACGHTWPEEGDWSFTVPVPQSSVDKVDAIREQALQLGWTEAGLYQNRGRYAFPCGEQYGLVCFLHSGRTISEVTKEWIEILGPDHLGYRWRFWRRGVKLHNNSYITSLKASYTEVSKSEDMTTDTIAPPRTRSYHHSKR